MAWTCPDTGTEQRGVVVGVTRRHGTVMGVMVLPDDGADELEALVSGDVGQLKDCGRINKGEPGTVLPVPAPCPQSPQMNPSRCGER
ncbi:hypothetical protein ACWD4F_23090 [Streptomyces aureus]